MQVQWNFNANQYEPNQGFSTHPPAQKVPFTITNTAIKETKDKTGGYLAVEFTSPQGVVIHNYNINNPNPKAVEIAYGQLSALCRAVNIYQIDGMNECAALRGGRGLMDVGYQKGEEPPEGKGYTELKKVYDQAGNEPGKPAQQQQQTQPLQQQPGGGWGQQSQQQQPSQQQPQGQQQSNGGAWQPGGAQASSNPPWGNRS